MCVVDGIKGESKKVIIQEHYKSGTDTSARQEKARFHQRCSNISTAKFNTGLKYVNEDLTTRNLVPDALSRLPETAAAEVESDRDKIGELDALYDCAYQATSLVELSPELQQQMRDGRRCAASAERPPPARGT